MTTPAKSTPLRKRVSIPPADESVLAWWKLQQDPSMSVRMLIRAEIERSGYVDVVNRPVEQLPRRGRPPGSSAESQGREPDDTGVPVVDVPRGTPTVAVDEAPKSAPAPVSSDNSIIDSIIG